MRNVCTSRRSLVVSQFGGPWAQGLGLMVHRQYRHLGELSSMRAFVWYSPTARYRNGMQVSRRRRSYTRRCLHEQAYSHVHMHAWMHAFSSSMHAQFRLCATLRACMHLLMLHGTQPHAARECACVHAAQSVWRQVAHRLNLSHHMRLQHGRPLQAPAHATGADASAEPFNAKYLALARLTARMTQDGTQIHALTGQTRRCHPRSSHTPAISR